MRILINKKSYDFDQEVNLHDAIQLAEMKPPYAVAVNMEHIPANKHLTTILADGDRIEVISPVTGG